MAVLLCYWYRNDFETINDQINLLLIGTQKKTSPLGKIESETNSETNSETM